MARRDMTPQSPESIIELSTCVLLAAGAAKRFGGKKLSAMLHDQMLGLYAAHTICAFGFGRVVAVCDPSQIALCDAYLALGIEIVENVHANAGQSASLQMGIAAAVAARSPVSIMIALADMPFVTGDHMRALYAAYNIAGALRPVASHNGNAQLPPAILPETIYRAMAQPHAALQIDQGAKSYLVDAILVHGDTDMLRDVDRAAQLMALNIIDG